MKILITGGAGFIGSNLSRRLAAEGHAVTVLDTLSPQIHGDDPARTSPLYRSIEGVVRFVQGSVCDAAALDAVMPEQEAIVHLAAETGTGQSMYEIRRYTEVNVGGTAAMLEWLARHPHSVRRLVVASSRAIYGEGKYIDDGGAVVYPGPRRLEDLRAGRFEPLGERGGRPLRSVPTDEESRLHPSSVYGVTKLAQEQLVMTVCPTLQVEPVALRYQNVYGPGQSLSNPYTGILSIFSTRILNGNAVQVFEDGAESRDFVYIDDVVEATCLGLSRPGAAGQVLGIGSGVATCVLDVAQRLVQAYARPVPITVTGAFRVGDIRHNVADLAKARHVLGFHPSVAFASGIVEFSRWVLGQAVAEDDYERSLGEMRDKGLFNT